MRTVPVVIAHVDERYEETIGRGGVGGTSDGEDAGGDEPGGPSEVRFRGDGGVITLVIIMVVPSVEIARNFCHGRHVPLVPCVDQFPSTPRLLPNPRTLQHLQGLLGEEIGRPQTILRHILRKDGKVIVQSLRLLLLGQGVAPPRTILLEERHRRQGRVGALASEIQGHFVGDFDEGFAFGDVAKGNDAAEGGDAVVAVGFVVAEGEVAEADSFEVGGGAVAGEVVVEGHGGFGAVDGAGGGGGRRGGSGRGGGAKAFETCR